MSVRNSFGTSGSYSSSVMPLQSGPNPVSNLTTVNGLFDITLNWSLPLSGGNNYCNVIGYSVFVNSEQVSHLSLSHSLSLSSFIHHFFISFSLFPPVYYYSVNIYMYVSFFFSILSLES